MTVLDSVRHSELFISSSFSLCVSEFKDLLSVAGVNSFGQRISFEDVVANSDVLREFG